MILKLMSSRGVGTIIYADFQKETISVENFTNRLLDTAFGVNQKPDWEDFQKFLEERCFPRTRDKLKLVLEDVGVQCYDPLSIVRKTKGVMAEDDLWIEIIEE